MPTTRTMTYEYGCCALKPHPSLSVRQEHCSCNISKPFDLIRIPGCLKSRAFLPSLSCHPQKPCPGSARPRPHPAINLMSVSSCTFHDATANGLPPGGEGGRGKRSLASRRSGCLISHPCPLDSAFSLCFAFHRLPLCSSIPGILATSVHGMTCGSPLP